MIDLKAVREHPERLDAALAHRGMPAEAQDLLDLDNSRRQAIQETEQLLAQNKQNASKSRQAKEQDPEEFARLKAETVQNKQRIKVIEQQSQETRTALQDRLDRIPNIPSVQVPTGTDESQNRVVKIHLIPNSTADSRDHAQIAGEWMDFSLASKISGSRFVVLKGAFARLHRALGQFMIDRHVSESGYQEVWVPTLVLPETLYGTGQLPKFEDDLYKTSGRQYLIPTAEVPLTNLVAETVIPAKDLPLRYVAMTSCFRSEAGAAGQDTKGMLRQHQFDKVELVSITRPESSSSEFHEMVQVAEGVLKDLELPYRIVSLCTGDLGFAAAMTYDLEVWLPGQQRYREISSCSNCTDFQARRMNARYRTDGKPEFVHTLNGSGVAVGRALIAVLENHQNPDGSVRIPEELSPYLNHARMINSQGELER